MRSSRPTRLLWCTTLLAAAPAALLAQEVTTLAPIVVQGVTDDTSISATGLSMGGKIGTDIQDTAASVSVVTAKELRDRGATTVEDAVSYTAGAMTNFYGGDNRFDYVRLRGFDATAYRDGLRLGRSFGNIREEIYAFERVEILKGSDSTLFGVSDPGGSVNYVTKLPRSERFGEAYATVGTDAHKEVGVDFGDTLTPDETLSYRFTAKVQDADGEIDGTEDDRAFVMGGLSWRPSDATTLSVFVDHLDTDGWTDPGHPLGTDFRRSRNFGDPDFNYVDQKRDAITLLFDHDFGGGLTLGASARYSDIESSFGYVYLSEFDATSPGVERSLFAGDTKTHSLVSDVHLAYDTLLDNVRSRTQVGVQFENRRSDNNTYYTTAAPLLSADDLASGVDFATLSPYDGARRKDEVVGFYAQQDFTFSDRLIVNLGLRHDKFDVRSTNLSGVTTNRDFSETTGRVGLTYKITPEVSAYASFAESATIAAVNGSDVLALDPETGKQTEIGVKYRPDGMDALFTAAVYDLTKSNVGRYSYVEPVGYYQLGKIDVRGIELEARGNVTDSLELVAAYAHADSDITGNPEFEGNELGKLPENIASVWANYTFAGRGNVGDMTFGLGARYTGSYFADDTNTGEKSDSAVVWDAAYSYDLRPDTELQLNVTNLFDEKHDAGASGAQSYNPGRQIMATIRRTW